MDGNQSESAQAHAGKTGKRSPRSIRFYDSEWERIETFAEQRGLTATEFVRFATLAAVEGDAFDDAGLGRLTPLVERIFRYCYVMATKLRDDMHGTGRGEEMADLVRTARKLQDELTGGASD